MRVSHDQFWQAVASYRLCRQRLEAMLDQKFPAGCKIAVLTEDGKSVVPGLRAIRVADNPDRIGFRLPDGRLCDVSIDRVLKDD